MDGFEEFVKEARRRYGKATGAMPNDETVSRFALAYQVSILNENIETFLEAEGLFEEEEANGNVQD